MAVQNRRRPSGLRILLTVLKILYIILFAISAFVLVLFLVFKVAVKPPEVEQSVQVTVPAVQTTPAPQNTPAVTEEPDVEATPTPTPTPEVIKLDRK